MQTGRVPERRSWRSAAACALLLLGALGGAGTAAAAFDLDALLKRVAVAEPADVPFEEKRYIGAVTEPLVSRGYLRFEPPDRLIKKVETPKAETAIATENRLSILDASGAETASIDLWMDPDLRLVFDSLRAVLRGDADALRAHFDTSLTGDEAAWTLTLAPKGDGDDTRIARIVVAGGKAGLERFEIRETGGDRSVIRLLGASARP